MGDRFRYNFSAESNQELGLMIRRAKESWPADKAPDPYALDYYDDLIDELLKRWACEDDAVHSQGQRL